ncbi:family 43 glycosylhydrolase [Parasediminibacterium sp. JCM 36343]|uniref:family 43 glycosylhydrolase n=1 Tax=Parasediminibacterium sp. JCM 36343 TaxID=3374279 RepID=UPI00397E7785
MKKTYLAFGLINYFFSWQMVAAQVKIEAAKTFPQSTIDSIKKLYTGVSGAGKPVAGTFFGGHVATWFTDLDVTEQNKDKYATGDVVKKGLLPNIKPIWDVNMRDAVIIVGGDGNYYLTGSTGRNIWRYNDGIEIYRSKDLKTWSYLGLVWSIDKDGGWEKLWRERHGNPVRAIWAPELHYINHNYYIAFSMPPGGIAILKSTTGKPEGPYTHATNPDKPLLGGIGPIETSYLIDPTLFQDDDGKVYFTHGSGKYIARMKDDLSDFAEPLREVKLLTPDVDSNHHIKSCQNVYQLKDIGFEGATLFKRSDKYYLGSTDKYEGRYSMMIAMSDNIYGPYTGRYEVLPCNGGTNFFKARNGDWFSCFFGDDTQAPWREKPGIIKVEFDKDGKIFIAKKQPDFILNK